ncbi:MAG TPA: PIN domain-containing protein [Balneolaceae bacterium]
MTVTIDTNILLHLLRETYLVPDIRETLDSLGAEDTIILSITSIGEIESIARQRNYGKRKRNYLKELLKDFLIIPIESFDLADRYAEIDAYSQGKLTAKPLPDSLSSRNMGKNDLWIAATASITSSALLSTDKDFEHLDGEYLDFIYIDPKR